MHLPTDLAASLSPEALHRFEAMPHLHQRLLVLPIEEADGRAARRHRIDTAVRHLRDA
jgi:hypothetical protein